jgi:hypothetical protein
VPLTSDEARALSRRRWNKDPESLDKHIDKLVKRAPALTPDQRAKLALLLRGSDDPRPAA